MSEGLIRTATLFLLLAIWGRTALGQEVILDAAADNTMFEISDGSLSNGSGAFLFVGATAQGLARRALIRFDLAGALPDGATIDSVVLELNMSATIAGATGIGVYRVTDSWGEGASNAIGQEGAGTQSEDGDATWIHRFFNSDLWQTPGGDFAPAPSAIATVDDLGRYRWTTTPAMLEDVESWIESPDQNFGWILIGDESASATAKRFDSRMTSDPNNRPSLRLFYRVTTAAEGEIPSSTAEIVSAWPNPFSDRSTVSLAINTPGALMVEVYDVTGRAVASLANGWVPAGSHTFKLEGDRLPAGLYMIRARHVPDRADVASAVLMKTLVLAR